MPTSALFEPRLPYFVGIDSDGCAFDTMDLKHQECFIPAFIDFCALQPVSRFARQAWEFVNLYSQSRGSNRFAAFVETLERLQTHPGVQGRGFHINVPASIRDWVQATPAASNVALERTIAASPDEDLSRLLAWSRNVNERIAHMVHGVPPFPGVRETLQRLVGPTDVAVVSATPTAALEAEWREHNLASLVRGIFGQECGTKRDLLAVASRYAAGQALMVGDAPGDRRAAAACGCLFFPILCGREVESWAELLGSGINKFLNGTFAGDYQAALLKEFDLTLPADPPWTKPA